MPILSTVLDRREGEDRQEGHWTIEGVEGRTRLTGCATSMLEVLAVMASGAWICCSTTAGMMKIGL